MESSMILQEDYGFNLSVINDSVKIFYPTRTREFEVILKVAVSITSVLSVLGSLLIILTYVSFKEIRTLARQLLVCLSIADLFVASASLLGLMTDISSLDQSDSAVKDVNLTRNIALGNWCKAQAAFLVFGTESSIFWTVAVAVYMFALVVVQPKIRRWGIKLVVVLYIICWGIPFVLTLWLAIDGFLWYDVAATPGFCAIVGHSTRTNTDSSSTEPYLYPIIVGYELWLYIAFIVLPVLYISVRCRVRLKRVSTRSGHMSLALKSSVKTQDVKLIFVPLIFLILRMWSVIVDICVYYLPLDYSIDFRKNYASAVLAILEGIGDTAQGAANGVLFCLFTNVVRTKLQSAIGLVLCHKASKEHSELPDECEGDNEAEIEQTAEDDQLSVSVASGHSRPLLYVNSNSYVSYSSVS